MGIFSRKPRDKEEFIDREREIQDKRIAEFDRSQEAEKEEARKVFSVRGKLKNLRQNLEVRQQKKLIKSIAKRKAKEAREKQEQIDVEVKAHGKVLSPEERQELEDEKDRQAIERAQKQAKRRAAVGNVAKRFRQAQALGSRVGSGLSGFSVIGTDVFNVEQQRRKRDGAEDLGKGASILDISQDIYQTRRKQAPSILDISQSLAQKQNEFGISFMPNLMGRKGKKAKRSKHPLSI